MVKILAFSAHPELHKEAINKAATMGDVVTMDGSKLPDQDPSTIAAAVVAAVKEHGIDLVMLGASKRGKEVGPRAAALLDWPYAAEIQSIERKGDGWSISRMVLSGNSKATYDVPVNSVVTVTAKTFGEPDAEAATIGVSVEPGPVKITGSRGKAGGDFDLGSAAFVVGVGRGFKAKEDITLAEALAAKLPGGAVGCSRPIAADLKWLGEEHWIGLSGHEIKPKAYIAVGVSGQIQHVAGIRGSKLIVAINSNKDAPIFGVCDYGIVGDLYKVLPALTDAL